MSPLKFKIAIAILALAGGIIKMLPDPQISAPVASAPPVRAVTTIPASMLREQRPDPADIAFRCSQLNVTAVPDIQLVLDNGQPIINNDGRPRTRTTMVPCPPPPAPAATAKPAPKKPAKVASR